MLKHFTIGLLLKLQQEMRYEQIETFDEVMEVAKKKKKKNMKEVPQLTIQSMTKVV